MHPNLLIVAILTAGFTLASFLAYLMQRLKLPSILGYLLAGYLIGPYSPGFVADVAISEQLAEIGVILMLFGVGLHFKIEDLIRVKNIAIPGAIGQTLVATLLTMFIVYAMGWSLHAGIIMGLSIGVASTVVLVRVLTDHNILSTPKGHIAVGWLVVEDIFTVLILILLPVVGSTSASLDSFSPLYILEAILLALAKFMALALLMFTIGHKIILRILTNIARTRSQELFTLTVLALVFLIAMASSVVFGTSIALGAFIAGMVIGKTNVRHQAAANALPLKDIFAVIFFLSVGMLFNPVAIFSNFPLFVGIIAVILIVKPLVAYLITQICGYSLNTALTVAISLAQIGEFSFILAEEALNLHLLPDEGFDILVACAMISISANPLLFQLIKPLEVILQKFCANRNSKEQVQIGLKQKRRPKVMIIGCGLIGRKLAQILKDRGLAPIIIEHNIDTVASMEDHNTIFFGDATDPLILAEAHISEASHLLITIRDTDKNLKIIHAARHINAEMQIVARAHYMQERHLFQGLNINYICTENEVLRSFEAITKRLFVPEEAIESDDSANT